MQSNNLSFWLLISGALLLIAALILNITKWGGPVLYMIPFDVLGYVCIGIGLFRKLRANSAPKT